MLRSLIDFERYHSIIRSWIYPPPDGVTIQFFPSSSDSERGLFAINIPEQSIDQKPFVLLHPNLDNDKRTDLLVGYVQRMRAGTEPTRPQDMQRLLRDGKRHQEIDQRLNSLTEEVRRLIEAIAVTSRERAIVEEPSISGAELARRMDLAGKDSGLDLPIFGLTAIPIAKVRMESLFGGRNSPVVQALENPPEIRRHGFNLSHGESSRIVTNELRRVTDSAWSVLELWHDGVLIYLSNAASSLGWSSQRTPRMSFVINPLVLCENTLLFIELTRILYEHARPKRPRILYQIHLTGLGVDGKPVGLRNQVQFYGDTRNAPAADFHAQVESDESEIDSGVIAYQLVAEVFRWFGFNDEAIPFTSRRNTGEMVIDRQQIEQVGRS